MATLAEIRAKLKTQEVNRSTSSGGDNAIYPHWNIQEGQEAVLGFYLIRILLIRFSGLKGI